MRLFALIFAVMATPAIAGDPAECSARYQVSYHTRDRYSDLGEGFVRWAMLGDGNHGIHNSIRVEHCATGESAKFMLSKANEGLSAVIAAEKRLDALAASDDDLSMDRIIEKLKPITLYEVYMYEPARWESCACSVAYPELRGDKTPYGGY